MIEYLGVKTFTDLYITLCYNNKHIFILIKCFWFDTFNFVGSILTYWFDLYFLYKRFTIVLIIFCTVTKSLLNNLNYNLTSTFKFKILLLVLKVKHK